MFQIQSVLQQQNGMARLLYLQHAPSAIEETFLKQATPPALADARANLGSRFEQGQPTT
jgi:hypothetical protein